MYRHTPNPCLTKAIISLKKVGVVFFLSSPGQSLSSTLNRKLKVTLLPRILVNYTVQWSLYNIWLPIAAFDQSLSNTPESYVIKCRIKVHVKWRQRIDMWSQKLSLALIQTDQDIFSARVCITSSSAPLAVQITIEWRSRLFGMRPPDSELL